MLSIRTTSVVSILVVGFISSFLQQNQLQQIQRIECADDKVLALSLDWSNRLASNTSFVSCVPLSCSNFTLDRLVDRQSSFHCPTDQYRISKASRSCASRRIGTPTTSNLGSLLSIAGLLRPYGRVSPRFQLIERR